MNLFIIDLGEAPSVDESSVVIPVITSSIGSATGEFALLADANSATFTALNVGFSDNLGLEVAEYK